MTQIEQSSNTINSATQPDGLKADAAGRMRQFSWVFRTLLISNFILLGLASWSLWHFGSFSRAVGYLRGERLFAERSAINVGRIAIGEHRIITYKILNISNKTVKILGANSSCTCANVVNAPLVITPGTTQGLKFDIHPGSKEGNVYGIFHAYTDFPMQPVLILNVSGTVRDDGPRQPLSAAVKD